MLKYLLLTVVVFSFLKVPAQQDTSFTNKSALPKNPGPMIDSSKQRDAIDILEYILNKKFSADNRAHSRKLIFAAVPALGYSLSTGFAVALLGNLAFYTAANHQQNLSAISLVVYLDTKTQKVSRSRSEIWFGKNEYKLVSDLRFERYPEDTYGLGTFTTNATVNHIDYLYLRTYATLYKQIFPDYFVGIGYNFDRHYNNTASGNADSSVSDFAKYGQTGSSTSSGPSLNFLYDARRNPINPMGGAYARVTFRTNFQFLGSSNNWGQVQVDLRKYIKVSPGTNNNILGFWGILAFTSSKIPYLDMPSTSSDMYNNSGRGYKQDRFRGKNELYLESEYRFGITKNGLIGAVVFANAESFSEITTNRFERFAPAAGTGLRVKINKHSNTNACFDYAYGVGSHGFFFSLGEEF